MESNDSSNSSIDDVDFSGTLPPLSFEDYQDILRQLMEKIGVHKFGPSSPGAGQYLWATIFLGIVYSIMIVVCGAGNLLYMIVVLRYKEMRTITNALVANLVLSDFLVAVFCVPFILDYHIVRPERIWSYDDTTCCFVNYLRITSLYVSTNSLLVIAIDRYLVIMMPHVPRMTGGMAGGTMALVWTVSMLLAVPAAMYSKALPYADNRGTFCGQLWPIQLESAYKAYYLTLLVIEFALPVVIMCFCYIRIALRIWFRIVPGQQTRDQQAAMLRSKKRNVRLLIVILVLFVLCWGPNYGYSVVRDFYPHLLATSGINITLHYVVEALAMSNGSINTIVYVALNANARKYIKKLAKECRLKWTQWRHRRVQASSTRGVSRQTDEQRLGEGDGRTLHVFSVSQSSRSFHARQAFTV
ncbi:prokineticin receptor 2-like [Branchiostoma floridae x Branchiostoma belcheri]